MRLPAPSTELRDSSGFTQNPQVTYRATRAGTYYVAIFAPDRAAPGDPSRPGDELVTSSPPRTPYTLTLDKHCSSTRTLRIPLARLRRRSRTMTSLVVYDNGYPRVRRSRGAISRRVTLRGLRGGRHRIVVTAQFDGQPRTRHSITVSTHCLLRLSR